MTREEIEDEIGFINVEIEEDENNAVVYQDRLEELLQMLENLDG